MCVFSTISSQDKTCCIFCFFYFGVDIFQKQELEATVFIGTA